MSEKNLASAVAYYQAMGNKNLSVIEKLVHPEIHFIGPLAELTGKEAYLETVKRFFGLFDKLTIRAKFASGDQAMLVCDLDCPTPIGTLRTAILMNLKEDLVARIELFLDPRPITEKQNELFSQS